MLYWVHLGQMILLTLVLSSCAAIPITAPIEATLGYRGGDREIGSIGGDGDTIALWLAILGLVITPLLGASVYKYVFRPFRMWRERNGNGNGNGTRGSSQGDNLCVKYSRWGPSSSPLPDAPQLGNLPDGHLTTKNT